MWNKSKLAILSVITIIAIVISLSLFYVLTEGINTPTPTAKPTPTQVPHHETPLDTLPKGEGTLHVGSELFNFNPAEVRTVRPDLFQHGYFSVFDVLVHLDKKSLIDLEYHFDVSMNTHIIDSINGQEDWWYEIYYDGGWPENNVFRPDHYPWKEKSTLRFFQANPQDLDPIYGIWKEEVTRKVNNNNVLLIPEVIIRGPTFSKVFKNIEVTPHNLRRDVFRENVTTAIDVILSLSEQGEITYELMWYESIGTARIVKDYWIEAINEDKAHGRCGFVYEAGSHQYEFFRGNHIHLPSDTRILNSPEYVEFFWICI